MSATCRDYTATAKELPETYDELGVDDQNVGQEARDDIRKVIRRLKRSAKRKAVPPWSVPSRFLQVTTPSVTRKEEALAVLRSILQHAACVGNCCGECTFTSEGRKPALF